MVDVPTPAAIGEVAATVDCAADTAAGFIATTGDCVTPTPLTVAETVFASARVELKVPVAIPLALVVPAGSVSVLPVPVAATTTVAPWMRFPNSSRAVTVIVDWLVPLDATIGDVAATLDWVADGAAAPTTTIAVWVIDTALIVADTVFDWATVELSVPVATPFVSVTPAAWVRVFPEPDAASTTVAPAIGLPNPSLAVTVIVDWLAPLEATTGDVAATVDWLADTVPVPVTSNALDVPASAPLEAASV